MSSKSYEEKSLKRKLRDKKHVKWENLFGKKIKSFRKNRLLGEEEPQEKKTLKGELPGKNVSREYGWEATRETKRRKRKISKEENFRNRKPLKRKT